MKKIKEKVRDQSPKIRNPASRLPKELVRSAMLEAKEKSSIMADKIGRKTGEESPVEYAGNRIQSVEQRVGKESASAAYRGGKKLAVKTYEKLKAQKQKQREAATTPLGEENARGGTSVQAGQTMAKKGRTEATRSIKVKPEAEKTIKGAGNRTVKTAPRVVKVSPVSSQKVKNQAVLQKKQALKSMKAAREAKRAAMHSVQTAKQSAKTAKATGRGLKAMAEATAHAVKAAFAALMAGGGAVLVVLILIVGIIGGVAFLGNSQSNEALSAEVLAHTPAIQKYASEFGIPEYVPAIQAIMMQESGGRGTDPMQASECPYNTQYPKSTYSLWRIVAIITLIGTLIGGGYAAYLSLKTVPEQRQLLAANEAFIQKDYRTCIDSLREVEPADMEKGTLYILAYSYANMESFRQDEMRNIIDNFSTSSNPKILEYWIRIGRLETKKAEEIALSLSDDKLLIYAYMKEADDLENNTKIDGSKKKQRLDELESQIEKLGDKYEPKEEETVEKIDGAVQENTSTQEPQTQEPTDTAQ